MPVTTDALSDWLEEIAPAGGLTPSQRRVADVLVKNQQLASYSEIAEIATRAMVNASTVVRFAQSLGFRGWPDLQQELRARYLAGLSSEETLTAHSTNRQSAVHDAVHRDIENLRLTLDTLDPADVEQVITALASAGQILSISMGSYSAPATVLGHLGSTMGYPITFEGRGGVHLATALNGLRQGDVLVVINMWRPMRELVAAAEYARDCGVTVVALTDMRKSPLATVANHVLVVPSEGVSFFQSVTAATSVVYGLLAGMEASQPERTREVIRRTQQLWQDIGVYTN
jgi:DNA-binding MurR/RpiR family transcriptional regulator